MRTWTLAASLAIAVVAAEPAHAACTGSPVSAARLRTLIDEAVQEYPRFEEGNFLGLSEVAFASVPCVNEVVNADLTARLHRMVGLRSRIVDGNDKMARLAFASARSADPSYELPSWLAGPIDPERAEYSAIPLELISRSDMREPTEEAGVIYLDGVAKRSRSRNVPTLYQRKATDKVVETTYLWPSDPDPIYEMVPIYEDRPPGPERLIVSGTSAGVAGAGIALMALALWDTANICPEEDRDVCRLQARDRVIGGTAMIVGGTTGFLLGQYFLDGGAGVGLSVRW